jgi:hypothetical protein
VSFTYPDGMEIGRVKAGHWRIEGYDVERTQPRRWKVTKFGRWVATVPTLEEACYAIDDDRYERRHDA